MPTKLNVGCGDRQLDGYINVDVRASAKPDMVVDASNLPFDDDSVDLLYASHILEHYRKTEIDVVLGEWRRVLVPHTGILQISVPDFKSIVRMYLYGDVALIRLWGLICGKQDYDENVHYTCWDYELLAHTLQANGFYNIDRWSPDVEHPNGFNDFSHGRINGIPISLNVQARTS